MSRLTHKLKATAHLYTTTNNCANQSCDLTADKNCACAPYALIQWSNVHQKPRTQFLRHCCSYRHLTQQQLWNHHNWRHAEWQLLCKYAAQRVGNSHKWQCRLRDRTETST